MAGPPRLPSVNPEYIRHQQDKKREAEEIYVENQRLRTWPIALMVALLCASLGYEFYSETVSSENSVIEIARSESESDVYRISIAAKSFQLKTKDAIPFQNGELITVFASPILGEINGISHKEQYYKAHLSFYQFRFYPVIAAILLFYTAAAARFKLQYWFQIWIVGLVFVFISAITFFITR